ncbi:MAG: NUDIX domain-containing protein [archaeon]|nr:NUDIX domain-containing protein [archaeon]
MVFFPIVLGIIFDPKTKKILIGKREKDKDIPKLTWRFPGGRPEHDEELEESIKREIKEETGLNIETIGVIFAKTYPEKKDLLAIYYLCEVISGKEKAGQDFTELKWVDPKDLEKYFTTSFHPKLKEYILGLKE